MLIIAYFMIGYFFYSYFNLHRNYYINVSLPFESKIPFVPVFILGYTAVYAAIILIYALMAMTIVVAVSVVLVKQHYILDVAGAVIITGMVFWLIQKYYRKWLT